MGSSRASSGSFWILSLFLAVLMLSPLCLAKYERPAISDRDLNRRKEACYVDIDNGLWGRGCRSSQIAKENCALRCVSGGCYNTVYGEDPLEEGEVDIRRGREFRNCLRKEIQEEKKLAKE
ncbi:hypothetical protein MPTK1_5g21280 [Marchantia polymorpha subsp. ruderalis]|uniref:Uncharacterized protein n=2 Tax=Marchantia polymorpha TaxID=3197 RepID=A0AAF6BKQ1_MARPO|nr:hypothetical protein MARPO_0058s0110 [Marchantia polymorpha]BBN12585.1 hypothetical protein Mp_5g21280 [Marchantia polymorpha subsp. ruderalis]|eukprot:PTQ37345.1 hypothetical protein MARPO_0058s0110 [Marchantia polymorpha]